MIEQITSITEDYNYVVGIVRGTSKNHENRPYVQVYVLNLFNYGDHEGYKSDMLFFWTDKTDPIKDYGIEINDQICPIYVGTGDFKKLKRIEVLKGRNNAPFEKAAASKK